MPHSAHDAAGGRARGMVGGNADRSEEGAPDAGSAASNVVPFPTNPGPTTAPRDGRCERRRLDLMAILGINGALWLLIAAVAWLCAWCLGPL